MDKSMIAVAAGMRARLEALDLLANNIANGSTAGYKADREFYAGDDYKWTERDALSLPFGWLSSRWQLDFKSESQMGTRSAHIQETTLPGEFQFAGVDRFPTLLSAACQRVQGEAELP